MLGRMSRAVRSLVHNVILHTVFAGRHKGRLYQEKKKTKKTAVAEVKNGIRLCFGPGKHFCVDNDLGEGGR